MGFLKNWIDSAGAASFVETACRLKYPDRPAPAAVKVRTSDQRLFQFTYLVVHAKGGKVSWWSIGSPDNVAVEVEPPADLFS